VGQSPSTWRSTIGIQPGLALVTLATKLPAAILARILGIHIKVAVAWQHASAGDGCGSVGGGRCNKPHAVLIASAPPNPLLRSRDVSKEKRSVSVRQPVGSGLGDHLPGASLNLLLFGSGEVQFGLHILPETASGSLK
jgi:hypothetical protein